MTDSEKIAVSDCTRHRLQSMKRTMYWFKERVKEFHREYSEDAETLLMLSSLEDYPFELLDELKKVEQAISQFEKGFLMSKRGLRWKWLANKRQILSTDLPASEVTQLKNINVEFEKVTAEIGKYGSEIGSMLDSKLADASDCLSDYDIDAKLVFELREDDTGYAEGSDNILKSLNLTMHQRGGPGAGWEIAGVDWPNGYEAETMSHGRVFHDLLMDYEHLSEHPPMNLTDMFRIGRIWCDIVVSYQYYYDMKEKKWVKKFTGTDSNQSEVTFVRRGDAR